MLPSLGLRVSERRLLLFAADSFLLSLALIISLFGRTDLLPNFQAILWNIKWIVTLVFIWAIVATIFDIYDLARAASTTDSIGGAVSASTVSSLIYLSIPWLTPPVENRSQAFIFVALSIALIASWRLLYANLFIQPAFHRKAIIIGAGRSARTLIDAMRDEKGGANGNPNWNTGHKIVGFIDDGPIDRSDTVAGIPILGGSDDLVSLALTHEVDELILALPDSQQRDPILFEAVLDCRELGLPAVTMTTIYERLTGRVAFEHVSWNVEVATGQTDNPFLRLYEVMKRLIDFSGAVLGLIVVFLFIPFVAFGNWLASPGPLFFRQVRVGKSGKIINIIKFRSMVTGAEDGRGAVWAAIDDERVTAVGRIMRLTHIDELPQVYNVLLGEMSLVGPRPERPEFVAKFSKFIPFYRARHSIRPGITGWAQIHQDYGDSIEQAKKKLEYDLYYLKHAGPYLDTVVILRTITKVLGFRGR